MNNNKFFYLERRLTEEEKTSLFLLGNKAIVFEKKKFRIYPQKNLFSHILGQIDDNNTGISGVEKFFDKDLKSKKAIGMHWGTFILTDEDILEPAQLINQELKKLNLSKDFFRTPKPGEIIFIE